MVTQHYFRAFKVHLTCVEYINDAQMTLLITIKILYLLHIIINTEILDSVQNSEALQGSDLDQTIPEIL